MTSTAITARPTKSLPPKVSLLCSNNDRISLSTETDLARQRDLVASSYGAKTLSLDLSSIPLAQVARFLLKPDPSHPLAASLESRFVHFGMDCDTGHLEISHAKDQEQLDGIAEDFLHTNGDHVYDHSTHRPCTLVSLGECSLCPARIPPTTFPGLPFTCHTPGGMRVHLPRHARRSPLSDLNNNSRRPRPTTSVSVPIDEEVVKCCKCPFQAKLADTLVLSSHLSNVHGDKSLFFCPACPGVGSYFYLPGTLRRHISSKHKDLDAAALEEALTLQITYMRLGDSKGKTKSTLEVVSSQKRNEESECWENEPIQKKKKHKKKSSEERRRKCRHCSKSFPSRAERRWHEKRQHPLGPGKEKAAISGPTGMPKEFVERVVHASNKVELICLVCQKNFGRESDLSQHWMSEHRGSGKA